MPKQQIFSAGGAPPAGAYSPGIRVGNFVFVSSQGPRDTHGNLIGTSIEEQTGQVLENIRLILEGAGATLDDVVKVGVYLSDLSLFSRYDQVYAGYFGDPRPTRTTIGCQLPGILIVMDAVAYIDDHASQ